MVKIMLRIFLTNLGKYNEGELVGEWVELPYTDQELNTVKERIGISDEPDENGCYYEEWFISSYDTDIDGLEIGEYDDINELNNFARSLYILDNDQLKAIQAFLQDGYSLTEALENAENNDYRIYDCDTMEEVAIEVVEECGYLDNVPDQVAGYFDYEAFGRDLDIEGRFYNIDGTMVELF